VTDPDRHSLGWFAYAPLSGQAFRPDPAGRPVADDAPPGPTPRNEVRLMNEYSCAWPVWDTADELDPVVEERIEAELGDRLRAWAATFEEHYDPFTGWDSTGVAAAHRAEGEVLRDALQAVLPEPWTVRWDAWEHEGSRPES